MFHFMSPSKGQVSPPYFPVSHITWRWFLMCLPIHILLTIKLHYFLQNWLWMSPYSLRQINICRGCCRCSHFSGLKSKIVKSSSSFSHVSVNSIFSWLEEHRLVAGPFQGRQANVQYDWCCQRGQHATSKGHVKRADYNLSSLLVDGQMIIEFNELVVVEETTLFN